MRFPRPVERAEGGDAGVEDAVEGAGPWEAAEEAFFESRFERLVAAAILSACDAHNESLDCICVAVVGGDVTDEFGDDVDESSLMVGFERSVITCCHGPGFEVAKDVGGAFDDGNSLDEPGH